MCWTRNKSTILRNVPIQLLVRRTRSLDVEFSTHCAQEWSQLSSEERRVSLDGFMFSLCWWLTAVVREEFTDAVVRELARKEGLVYLLWGKPAQLKWVTSCCIWSFTHTLWLVVCFRCENIDAEMNTIITCSHPSPLFAYKTDQPFIGSRWAWYLCGMNDDLIAQMTHW